MVQVKDFRVHFPSDPPEAGRRAIWHTGGFRPRTQETLQYLPAVRAAYMEVFAFRGTHGWPPASEPPAFWEELYAELVEGLELAEETLEDAVREARGFIEAIDAARAQ